MEEWKFINGMDGRYQVSNLGRVRSVNRQTITKSGFIMNFQSRILVQCYLPKGYCYVGLLKPGYRKSHRTHRLVAQAFIPNPENKPEVNHKNGIKDDNRVENLEWATSSENSRHSWDVLKRSRLVPHIEKEVIQVSLDGFLQNVFKSRTEAANFLKLGIPAITNAINRGSICQKSFKLY